MIPFYKDATQTQIEQGGSVKNTRKPEIVFQKPRGDGGDCNFDQEGGITIHCSCDRFYTFTQQSLKRNERHVVEQKRPCQWCLNIEQKQSSSLSRCNLFEEEKRSVRRPSLTYEIEIFSILLQEPDCFPRN